MARLTAARTIRWAGVAFQPDLQKPVKPVKLGIILFQAVDPSSMNVAVIGRAPNRKFPPKEFENTGAVTMSIIANWVDNLCNDAIASEGEDVFEALARRWGQSNLFFLEPKTFNAAKIKGPLAMIAGKLYEKFVGEPFKSPEKTKKLARKPMVRVPSTWKRKEVVTPDQPAIGW